jgi:hypothetical protein
MRGTFEQAIRHNTAAPSSIMLTESIIGSVRKPIVKTPSSACRNCSLRNRAAP